MPSVTSVLQQPRLQPFARSPTTGGILLNPSPDTRPFSLPLSSYPSRSNQSLSSTSSSEGVNTPPLSAQATPPSSLDNSLSLPCPLDDDHVPRPRSGSAPDYGSTGSRRIRFAPLPDPRRAVLVTEHGQELPLSSVFDDDPSGIPRPDLHSFPTSHSSSLLLGDDVVTSKERPTIVTSGPSSPRRQCIRPSASSPPSPIFARPADSPTPSTATVTPAAPLPSTPSTTRFAKRLLDPFRQKADSSRRSGSRDSSSSRDDASPSLGIPLCNWTSADAGSQSSSAKDAPLARVQSATSARPSKPKRLLNGRVYGARNRHHNQSTNVFGNIPDDEPEFVEWGHGGMGSVRAGGIWAKVQSDQKLLIGHMDERGRRGAPESPADDDDYDGSGMGWLKKRREERERKKREEQAAREPANKVDAASPASSLVSAPVPASSDASTHISARRDISTVTPIQARSEDEDDDDYSDDEDEEVVKDDSVDNESSGTEQEDDNVTQEQYIKQVVGAGVERVSRHRD